MGTVGPEVGMGNGCACLGIIEGLLGVRSRYAWTGSVQGSGHGIHKGVSKGMHMLVWQKVGPLGSKCECGWKWVQAVRCGCQVKLLFERGRSGLGVNMIYI